MKFTKDTGNGGDFKEFDAEVLLKELIVNLGEMGDPQKWNLSTSDNEINVNILDDNLVTTGVAAIVTTHGNDPAIIVRAIVKRKSETDISLVSKLRESYSQDEEYKCLQLGIESGTDVSYVAYKTIVMGLRSQATIMKTAIDTAGATSVDYTVSIPAIEAVDITFT